MNAVLTEAEMWHAVRENLSSLQAALERWGSRIDYTVRERTHNGFMARGVGQAIEYWHVVTEDQTSDSSLREQLARMVMADYEAGGLNYSMREGLRVSARLICAVYATDADN